MNRRHFIKSIPALAAAASVVNIAPKPVQPPKVSSMLLTWTHPDDPLKRYGSQTWNTPTAEALQEAQTECLKKWALLASRGYRVDSCQFDVLRFV